MKYLSEWADLERPRVAIDDKLWDPLVEAHGWLWDHGLLRDQLGPFWELTMDAFKDFEEETDKQLSVEWFDQRSKDQGVAIIGKHNNGAYAVLFYDGGNLCMGWISNEQAKIIDSNAWTTNTYFTYIHPWAKYLAKPGSNVMIYFGYGEKQKPAPYQHENTN